MGMGHLWLNGLGIYDLMGEAFSLNGQGHAPIDPPHFPGCCVLVTIELGAHHL